MSSKFYCVTREDDDTYDENNDLKFPKADTPRDKPNDIRLQDIETQLEMAESRCNNLKDQLDYMKQVYGANRSATTNKTKKSTNSRSTPTNSTLVIEEEPKNVSLTRQKSNHIETDNTGAAVRTINNILNGITNSVNRLSEIHSQLTTPRVKISTGVSADVTDTQDASMGIVPELKLGSTSALQTRNKGQKRKCSKMKTGSQYALKKPSRIEKRPVKSIITNTGLDKKSSTVIKSRFLSKFNATKANNLVEIYHNDAVKHSDSDESNLKKSRQHQERNIIKCDDEIVTVPPLDVNNLNPLKDIGNIAPSAKSMPGYSNQPFSFDPPNAPRTTVSCCYSRNYELPTVASRMKQVAKSYLGTLNIKTIPFCAAISTSQSHNIGINIQQVMNIIKNRQPINGISPTLAHNIGLAAEKLNGKPLSTLVSTINSRISQTVSRCPLSKTYLNFQQLQEQAKNIPEDIIEEVDENDPDSPKMKSIIITGPSGDMEIKTKNIPSWKAEKTECAQQCTCVEQSNIGLHHVASKYQSNIKTITSNMLTSQISENPLKKKLRRYKTTKNSNSQSEVPITTNVSQDNQKLQENSLNGREKNLKAVLTNLHNDFESLNQKYEDLSQKSQSDCDDASILELERLEAELNKKEEEITMVMALYKEVLALKQQVKQLKDKRSQASIPSKDAKETKIKFKEYHNPEAAFHLTKLLKQIQHYQSRYKTNLSQE